MLFFLIILIIGVFTTFTDLKNKKIYNQHLVLGAVLGLLVSAYAAIFRHEHVLFHFFNGLVAFIIGFILHRSETWRGGDAKLFTLYAFLMPHLQHNHGLLYEPIYLFACSFTAGMIILTPLFIKDIMINHKVITNELFSVEKLRALLPGIIGMIFFSWIMFPIYYIARITNPVIILIVSFLIFSLKRKKYHFIDYFKKNFFVHFTAFIFGFLTRFMLSPNSLSLPALTQFLVVMIVSICLSIFIHTTINHFKDYQERVPFAPLLFIGCLLSYTPFLTRTMHLVTQWNALFSR